MIVDANTVLVMKEIVAIVTMLIGAVAPIIVALLGYRKVTQRLPRFGKEDLSPLIALMRKPNWQNQRLDIEETYFRIFKRHRPASQIILAATQHDNARKVIKDIAVAGHLVQFNAKDGKVDSINPTWKWVHAGKMGNGRFALGLLLVLSIMAAIWTFVLSFPLAVTVPIWIAMFAWAMGNSAEIGEAKERLLAITPTFAVTNQVSPQTTAGNEQITLSKVTAVANVAAANGKRRNGVRANSAKTGAS